MKIFAHALASRARWLKRPINSGPYRHWLIDSGSLTRRLQLHCHNFNVKPLRLYAAKPQTDEVILLNLSMHQHALLREVYLYCGAMPVVFAHSVLPHQSLRGRWHKLGALGNKPLGGALFSNPQVVRTPLEFKKLAKHHALYLRATAHLQLLPPVLWARRSVFILHGASILVTEVFLPQVLTV